jgi:hypothetical protein
MFLGSKVRWVRRADNLTAVCEPIVYTMYDLQHLRTLQAYTACYRDSFSYILHVLHIQTNPGERFQQKLCSCYTFFDRHFCDH